MAAELGRGALLSAFLQVLLDRLASGEVVGFFGGKKPIVDLLTELTITLSAAGLLLHDAEEKLIKDPNVRRWLDELKDAVYDAGDLVYKIDTEALRNEMEDSGSSRTSKVLLKLNPISVTAFDRAIKPKIEEILVRLKVLLAASNNLGLNFVEIKELPKGVRAPLVEDSEVYGRDADKEAVIKLLLSDDASGEPLSVIPIVGMGGIGKTTLAQLVYNDAEVCKNFDCRAWVTVGDDRVDYLQVMKAILQMVLNSEEFEIEDLYELQIQLKEVLKGKKFFFVLDDIWDAGAHNWEVLKNSFKSGLHGSKIVVTTRNTKVASIVKNKVIHHLEGVSNDDGWRLFMKHALIDVVSNEHSNLQEIGRKIVNNCKGLPLALKSLGSLLRDKRKEREWEDILKSDTWGLFESSSIAILPALWLNYLYLPSHLKQCFAYCAFFPKDHVFKKENVILLWMAEGFLDSTQGKRMEEVGEEYFQDLISRSFFQRLREDESTFVTHDLLHDLAIFVSGEFCLEMNDSNFSTSACKIRHCSYNGQVDDFKTFELLSKAKGLHTFLTFPGSKSIEQWSLWMERLLKTLLHTSWGCLRVFSVSRCNIIELPDSIGDLKYLKYLDLSYTKIEEIPRTICTLYNLQTLLLEGCLGLTRLPMEIGNLINLRHLYTPPYLQMMPRIDRMKNLQTLSEFVVGKNTRFGINMLKELQELHGGLRISRLENVVSAEDVLGAELKGKRFLRELILGWGFSHFARNLQKEEEVLGALEPHAGLKELAIHNYPGSSFPNWVGDYSFSNVVTVKLFDCKNCCSLPPLGQLANLKHLYILGFHRVEKITSEFYSSDNSSAAGIKPFRSLETLEFCSMLRLQEWLFTEGEIEGGVFPCLKELELRDCPKLKVSLPDYLPSLKKLVIHECDQLLPLLPRAQDLDSAFPSLETMRISDCHGQELLLEGRLPSSLKEIVIFGCENIEALDDEAFQCLTSLEKLEISFCVSLQFLPKGLPTSLSHLRINNCPLLTPRLQKETGEDWPIICHIPRLDIHSHPLLK